LTEIKSFNFEVVFAQSFIASLLVTDERILKFQFKVVEAPKAQAFGFTALSFFISAAAIIFLLDLTSPKLSFKRLKRYQRTSRNNFKI